jgi:hypothetical protein
MIGNLLTHARTWLTRDAVRHNGLRMAVNDAIDFRVPLENLTVDAALGIPFGSIRLHRLSIIDPVLDQIGP